MNIQIFGTKKSFDSKKAERYFKERGIKYQFIDMKEKGMSKGELQSVCRAVGGLEALIDKGRQNGKSSGKPEGNKASCCEKRQTGNSRICAGHMEKLFSIKKHFMNSSSLFWEK